MEERDMKRTIATLGVVGLGLMGATVAANAAPDNKITICHATGSASNPYLAQTISLSSLGAHVGDTGDIVPANGGDDMPNGQNLTPANIILLANGCVAAAPVVPPVVPPVVDPPVVVPPVVDPPVVVPPVVDPPVVVPPVVDSPVVVPPAIVPAVTTPAAVTPAAVTPAAAAPAAVTPAAVTPVASTPQGAVAASVPAATNTGYNVQTAVGTSGSGIPAWLAVMTVLFTAVGGWVLVKSGLRSRGADG
jgi:hypothetical protein